MYLRWRLQGSVIRSIVQFARAEVASESPPALRSLPDRSSAAAAASRPQRWRSRPSIRRSAMILAAPSST